MSTPLVVGDVVRLRIWLALNTATQAAVNTVNYVVAAVGATPATDQDVANQMDFLLAPLYRPLVSALATYRGCQAQILKSTPPYPAKSAIVFSNTHAGVGTGSADLLPTQTCGVGSFQTNLAGAKNRGRLYIAFPSVGDQTGSGVPTSGYVASALTLIQTLAAGIAVVGTGTATMVRVILHGKDKSGVVDAPTPVQHSTMDVIWGTQRRRGAFGRQNISPI